MSNINFEEDQREDLDSVNEAGSLAEQVVKLQKSAHCASSKPPRRNHARTTRGPYEARFCPRCNLPMHSYKM